MFACRALKICDRCSDHKHSIGYLKSVNIQEISWSGAHDQKRICLSTDPCAIRIAAVALATVASVYQP